MSFLTVFLPSLVITVVVGAFLFVNWQVARKPGAIAAFFGFALLVHLMWAAIPHLGLVAPLARWLAIMWFGSMLAALMLLVPFAALTLLSHRQRLKAVSDYLPIAYVSSFLIAGLILSVTSTAGYVVRQEDIRIPNPRDSGKP
jgi:uncharacterized protein